MTKRILIDAVHAEEVRVVMAQDERLEEFDFEVEARKQIKGNIYLGKITRVEPSLQAVFVEYGGNKQGFLPFAEVHYDYYQIPVEDREKIAKLLEESASPIEEEELDEIETEEDEEEEEQEEQATDEDTKSGKSMAADTPKDASTTVKDDEKPKKTTRKKTTTSKTTKKASTAKSKEKNEDKEAEESPKKSTTRGKKAATTKKTSSTKTSKSSTKKSSDSAVEIDEAARKKAEELERIFAEEFTEDELEPGKQESPEADQDDDAKDTKNEKSFDHEELGGGDDAIDARRKRSSIYRNYKVQEVLKRNQVILVQVMKEERGNKGASLTTYISLAGRFCVYMPNTERAGGVSRRITDIKVRKKLRDVIYDMDVPKGASVILRTAGVERKKKEIIDDFQYLQDLWQSIRKNAVSSVAPELIYEEGNIIKRCLRDMFRDDVDEILVDGEHGYAAAKEFFETMVPDKIKKLKQYDEPQPLFRKFNIDEQLDELYENEAKLPSGGAIVINPTEALVSIDVNSGRSTREWSIEDTAIKTNLEAAKEIARQLRLRDLAGLVEIDFIDMRELKNKRNVERALKEALKSDRARIQVGRISSFGLLEMSRQRMRSSIVETSSTPCPHCHGTGYVRSDESVALKLLRTIEAEANRTRFDELRILVATPAAFYLLNHKREELDAIEERTDVQVVIDQDHALAAADYSIDKQRGGKRKKPGSSKSSAPKRSAKKYENKHSQKRHQPSHYSVDANKDVNQAAESKKDDEAQENVGNESESTQKSASHSQKKRTGPRSAQGHKTGRSQSGRKPTRNNKPANIDGNKGQKEESSQDGNYSAANDIPANTKSGEEGGDDSSKLRGLWKKITQ